MGWCTNVQMPVARARPRNAAARPATSPATRDRRAAAAPTAPEAAAPEGRAREILDAALRVIAAGGTEAVTHRRVAAEAGVPLGSTSYWFTSRDALVREAFRHYVAGVYAFLVALEQELPIRSAADVVSYLVEVARRESQDPDALRVEYELILRAARDPELARAFRHYERTLESRLAERLEVLGAGGPFEAARTLVALVRGFELDALVRGEPDPEDLRRRIAPVVHALLDSPARSRAAKERR